jgi:hypothetical protein
MEIPTYKQHLLEKNIAKLHDEIDISIELDTTNHAEERKHRHSDKEITDEDIIATVNMSLDEIGERQFKGIDKVGQKYWIYDKDNFFLNVIAEFKRDKKSMKMVVITVMRKEKFIGSKDTVKIEIK